MVDDEASQKKKKKIKLPRHQGTDSMDKLEHKAGGNVKLDSRSKIGNFFGSIRVKLLIAIAIPIAFMGAFGWVSYQKTAKAIISNYEINSLEALNATKNNLWTGFETLASLAYNMINKDAVRNYYDKFDRLDEIERSKNYETFKTDILTAKSTNNYIYNVHIFGKKGESYSTSGTMDKDYYNNFLSTEQGAAINTADSRFQWISKHDDLDNQLNNIHTAYSVSLVRKLSENNGFIVIDLSTTEVQKVISQINFGEESFVGYLAPGGVETLAKESDKTVFANIDYFQNAVKSTETSGFNVEKVDGKEYLLIYSQMGNSGSLLCAMIPQDFILAKANEIKRLNAVFVVVSCIISIMIGVILANGISKEIAKLIKSIGRAAKGDLTVEFKTKRRDEFKILTESLFNMITNMRALIVDVAAVGGKVNDSAIVLSETTDVILSSTRNISTAIDEIGEGVVQQASDTEQCSDRMGYLAEQIANVNESTYEIEKIANGTKSIIINGTTIVDDLNQKSVATSEITHEVIKEIQELEEQSHSISQFVKIINGIASQTNLLSLNASIEAARAGEAGRGFSVVAEEIRKLADQSVEASNQIREIVDGILEKTKVTATAASKSKSMVESQMDALKKTVDSFERMSIHVNDLINHMNHISIGVKSIEDAKDSTIDSISNISAVAEESAASAEEVRATAVDQIGSTEELSKFAHSLKEEANKLENAIQNFKI